MRNYRDLQVWSNAHDLTLELYRVSRDFPREEMFGVTSQLRRAAASIGATGGRVRPSGERRISKVREDCDGIGERARLSSSALSRLGTHERWRFRT